MLRSSVVAGVCLAMILALVQLGVTAGPRTFDSPMPMESPITLPNGHVWSGCGEICSYDPAGGDACRARCQADPVGWCGCVDRCMYGPAGGEISACVATCTANPGAWPETHDEWRIEGEVYWLGDVACDLYTDGGRITRLVCPSEQ